MAFLQNTKNKQPECFLCGGDHYMTKCPYQNQFKKARLNEQREPPPNAANLMLINNTTCQEINDKSDVDEVTDLYNFSFTNAGTEPITTTQEIVMSQHAKGKKINKYWILLDSQSTISIFNNKKLLQNIRKCKPDERVRCYCNGGFQDTDMIGTVKGLGEVYYNPASLANILSLAHVNRKGF